MRRVKLAASGLVALVAAYLVLLAAPYPLFAYQAGLGNITVYSDHPIPSAINSVLGDTEARLARSPLNDLRVTHRIFVCNDHWRWVVFSNYQYRVGGVNYAVLNQNMFLRRVNIEHNRLIGGSGQEVEGERTLAHFFAHEIGHSLEVNYLGRWAHFRLPVWKREGYADVVGGDGNFDYAAELEAFRRGDVSMDPLRSGLYSRYQLEVEYLFREKHLSPEELLTKSFDVTAVDSKLRLGIEEREK
jgi:hypothetical protein